MQSLPSYPEILAGKKQLGLYPMEKLKHVDQPTTKITGNIERTDEREHGFSRAERGELGPLAEREYNRFCEKYPISCAMWDIPPQLGLIMDGEVALDQAPIPQDPGLLSRHIKSLGYFLRADIVGICRLPQWSVYSYDRDDKPVECNHSVARHRVNMLNPALLAQYAEKYGGARSALLELILIIFPCLCFSI